MIAGSVSIAGELRIPIDVRGVDGAFRAIEVVVDAGFSGCLALPAEILEPLAGMSEVDEKVVFANGSVHEVAVKYLQVRWHDSTEWVRTFALPATLLGMSLLHGSRVRFDAVEGGTLEIIPLGAP